MSTPAKAQGRSGRKTQFEAPTPWPEPVEGGALLSELATWIGSYLYLPPGAADAIAAWVIATWLVAELYFAPILALMSPTKRCGKTTLLYMLQWVVQRGHLTSGVGVTSAVLFRLNEKHQPTLLIDEAEKLRSYGSGSDIVSLLNAGYRKGHSVQRCVETDGDYDVRLYDAFGFRAVALIGSPWDTISDRSITISMQRKPRDRNVTRFNGHAIDREGEILAQKIARWVEDNHEALLRAESRAPHPPWLNDRECDNWAPLFAVAEVAGSDWPTRLSGSARLLRTDPGEDGDRGERLIQDIRAVFAAEGDPEAMKSGDLATALSAIETSPWGSYSGGKCLSTHKLAMLLKPFGVKPIQARVRGSTKIRGYWLHDLHPVFERYPPRSDLGRVGQASSDARSDGPTSQTESGTIRTRKWDGQNPHDCSIVPLVPLQLPPAPERLLLPPSS